MIKPKIKIVCISKTNSKLAFVKLLKEFADLGLKDSKDLVDQLNEYNDSVEFDYESNVEHLYDKLSTFRRELEHIGMYLVTCLGAEMEREHKLLSIGIGERQEYVDFLNGYMKVFKNFDDVLKLALSYLSDDELVDVVSKLEK